MANFLEVFPFFLFRLYLPHFSHSRYILILDYDLCFSFLFQGISREQIAESSNRCISTSSKSRNNVRKFLFSLLVQCWPKETLQVLFYEAKVPTSDG